MLYKHNVKNCIVVTIETLKFDSKKKFSIENKNVA